MTPNHCRRVAEDLDGPYVRALRELARDFGLHIVSGMTEHDPDDDRIYNSSVLLDPSGRVIGHYRKQFLATHDRNWFEAGNRGNVVVDTAIGRIGPLICFDGRIPEIADRPRARGLVRTTTGGGPIEVEVYRLPRPQIGGFLATVAAPLSIGVVELADGTAVHGFVCETAGPEGAEDIPHLGGWRGYLDRASFADR